MKASEVRKRFLDFYAKRGHAVIPSAPIVPENDPTTLFTSSGMQPLVPYLLGEPHPEGTRLADSQMAVRTGDIEEVGDNRHLTFFEMLGNWSLGDYFKQEQLPWVFEFITSKGEGLDFDPSRLYVTVFDGDPKTGIDLDTESVEIWKRLFAEKGIEAKLARIGDEKRGYEIGMQGGRIFSYSDKNWWSRAGAPGNMPTGEPGGPDSEIFYDFGTPHDPKYGKECHPNCDCGRFVEICNSVFMQFVKKPDGTFGELPKRNVDFGGGLERLTATTLGTDDLYQIDIFEEARALLETRSGKTYEEATRAFRIVLDHTRAATFMIASGVRPGNTERPYVLRRLVRRALRMTDNLGIKEPVLADIANAFVQVYKDAYPQLAEAHAEIRTEIEKEETQFRKTLTAGMRELEKHVGRQTSNMDPETVFMLYTTYGFPIELTEEIAKERGLTIDMDAVKKYVEEHQAKSRAGAAQKFAGGLADHAEQTVRYHTAHHLLLKALQIVLGPHVHQRGSNITSERLRIDFSHDKKMTADEIAEVEKIVNEKIAEALPIVRTDMPKEEAMKLGAEQEFGANYPDTVSVYSVGPLPAGRQVLPAGRQVLKPFSIEFCGGPHVSNTADIGAGGKKFVIQKEEASSAGVRRIKAVLK